MCLCVCSCVCINLLFVQKDLEVKNSPFTFVPNRYDRGMVTVCIIDLPVIDAAHCLGRVDRLSGGRSTTVIDS